MKLITYFTKNKYMFILFQVLFLGINIQYFLLTYITFELFKYTIGV